MNTVFIGGSRHISRLSEQVKERLRNVIQSGAHVVVGDANGADKAVQGFLFDALYANVTVYCSGEHTRNNIGRWSVHAVTAPKAAKGYDFYAAKDREMAQTADFGLMVWDGKSPGTVLNVLRLLQAGKKAVLINERDKQTTTFKTPEHWAAFVAHIDPDLLGDLKKRATPEEWSLEAAPSQASFLEQDALAAESGAATASSPNDDVVAAELNAALASGDAATVVDALGNAAKARGMTRISKETGLARESLYRSLGSDGNPEFNTVLKVLSSMGLRLMVGKADGKARNQRP